MKKVIITLLLSLMITNMFSFTFQTEYNYQIPTFGITLSYIPYNNSQSIEYRGIGYTTNYSNGQFNSTQYYQGTYTLVSSSSSGGKHGGKPRKVSGLDGWIFWGLWGSSHGIPSTASNDDMYDYYNYITSGGTKGWNDWYKEKYNPTPIRDNYIWFMVCIVSIYSLIKGIKLKRLTN